ncbi:MAG: pentapeptide repeat-containing protein [Candidatus Brocadiales bacterium]|nr:pentapeptide repeat-containing protein [Candidatus Brocadiales bacterium]
MGHVKNSLSAAALVISIGIISMVLDTQTRYAYGATVKENIQTLLNTNSCPGCDLSGADLKNTDLTGANLNGATLRGADLSGCELENVDLRGANLEAANLSRADLNGADMSGASLNGAWVEGADFLGVRGLTPEQKQYLKKNGAIVPD